MRKVFLITLAAVCATALMSTVAFSRTLRINESLGPGSVEEFALKAFKRMVEEESDGELKIRIYLQDQLGDPQTSIENLMPGTLDLYSGALSYYNKLAPKQLSMLTMLYFFKDREHFLNYLTSPIFAEAKKKILEQGIRFISTEFNGDRGPYRVFICTKPIMEPQDLEGVKMRIWPNEPVKKCWQNMGAVPMVIPWTDVYLSIKQGMIQAVTAPLTLVKTMRFTEVAPYVTELKQFHQTWPITISEKVWQSLEEDQQKLLVKAANQAGKVYAEEAKKRTEADIQNMMREDDAVFIRVNTAQFEQKMLPYYETLIEEGFVDREIFEAVQALK